jgi:hypothetical protein
MTDTPVVRRTSVRGRILVAVLAVIAPLAFASSAFAVEHHPTGDFAPFADCPLSNSATHLCIHAKTESGKIIIGKKTVPITNTITLQGGVSETPAGEQHFIGAEDGNTLSKTPQVVPGGLLGAICEALPFFLKGLCEEFTSKGLSEIKATTELAAPASSIGISIQNLFEEEGTALSLPVKVHLENLFLGSKCYIGSNANPITIPLTTGTTNPPAPNTPIKGKLGTVELKDELNLAVIKENELVNNSFAAPKSEGCGGIFSFLVGPVLDGQLGLPSAAGHNTAVLAGTLEDANAEAVKASEK